MKPIPFKPRATIIIGDSPVTIHADRQPDGSLVRSEDGGPVVLRNGDTAIIHYPTVIDGEDLHIGDTTIARVIGRPRRIGAVKRLESGIEWWEE